MPKRRKLPDSPPFPASKTNAGFADEVRPGEEPIDPWIDDDDEANERTNEVGGIKTTKPATTIAGKREPQDEDTVITDNQSEGSGENDTAGGTI